MIHLREGALRPAHIGLGEDAPGVALHGPRPQEKAELLGALGERALESAARCGTSTVAFPCVKFVGGW
jgi:hypothetical protein